MISTVKIELTLNDVVKVSRNYTMEEVHDLGNFRLSLFNVFNIKGYDKIYDDITSALGRVLDENEHRIFQDSIKIHISFLNSRLVRNYCYKWSAKDWDWCDVANFILRQERKYK